MKYLSLFSGIGGFELGIQQAYETLRDSDVQAKRGREETSSAKLQKTREGLYPISSKTTLHPKDGYNELSYGSFDKGQLNCVGFSEIDKYAVQIYQKHFPEHKNHGDITKIKTKELPKFELLVGGFPCQSFSIAGKRGGFNDSRGTMFFEIARTIKDKQPRLLLLENVKGLLSHDEGRTFATIISTLDELGYDLQWQVLNSKNFGVPQNRERVFIVGHIRGTSRPKVFPFTGTDGEDFEQVTSTALDANYWEGIDNHGQRTVIVHNIYGGFKEEQARIFEKISPTIRTSKGGGHLPSVLKGSTIRRLTPVECERLQGFPDNWTAGVSDTQRYKMCGNAVTVNVVQAIMEKLLSTVE